LVPGARPCALRNCSERVHASKSARERQTVCERHGMFIAMNRFKVVKESAEDFEQVWLGRDSHLGEMEGFVDPQPIP
jgi:hypothetical protein